MSPSFFSSSSIFSVSFGESLVASPTFCGSWALSSTICRDFAAPSTIFMLFADFFVDFLRKGSPVSWSCDNSWAGWDGGCRNSCYYGGFCSLRIQLPLLRSLVQCASIMICYNGTAIGCALLDARCLPQRHERGFYVRLKHFQIELMSWTIPRNGDKPRWAPAW